MPCSARSINRCVTLARGVSPSRSRSHNACRSACSASSCFDCRSIASPRRVQSAASYSAIKHACRKAVTSARRSPRRRARVARAAASATGSAAWAINLRAVRRRMVRHSYARARTAKLLTINFAVSFRIAQELCDLRASRSPCAWKAPLLGSTRTCGCSFRSLGVAARRLRMALVPHCDRRIMDQRQNVGIQPPLRVNSVTLFGLQNASCR